MQCTTVLYTAVHSHSVVDEIDSRTKALLEPKHVCKFYTYLCVCHIIMTEPFKLFSAHLAYKIKCAEDLHFSAFDLYTCTFPYLVEDLAKICIHFI